MNGLETLEKLQQQNSAIKIIIVHALWINMECATQPDQEYSQSKTSWTMLDKLKEMTGGDEKRMTLYLSTYKHAAEDQILSMSMALEDDNYSEIRIIVHTAKPLLKVLGLDDLWECANEIEVSIDTNNGLELLTENCEEFLSLTQDALNEISAHYLPSDS